MDRKIIEDQVRAAILAASGKSASVAVRVISDAVEALLGAEESFVVAEDPVLPGPAIDKDPGQPIIRAADVDRLDELVPINGTTRGPRATYREFYTPETISETLNRSAPDTIEVMPSGYAEPLQLKRSVTIMAMEPGGVQLAYKVAGADPGVAFPKSFFWVTDEKIDIPTALGKMKSDALLMYARRTKPIESRPQVMAPVETRMNSAGTVIWDGK